jgi:hypothetical protein
MREGSDLSKHNFDRHRPPATGHHCIQTLALLHKTSGTISQFVMFIHLDKINYPFPITKSGLHGLSRKDRGMTNSPGRAE